MPDKYTVDEALILCAKEKDAFRALYEQMYKSVCAVCYSVVCNRDEAQECAQETFARLPYLSKKYKRGTNPKAFIYKVAQNTAKELYRKKSREYVGIPEDIRGESGISRLESDIYVSQLLSVLDTESRTIIILYVFEELTFEQIAQSTGRHQNTVRKKYKKAIEKLKGAL